ncbi:MAG: DNA-binding response regulator [Ignavibacteriales bacterium]|jgi:DNA-binding NarL/FixJ family response regulator|nr:MAG: DNA-binding response regulator [Ignavibacteriales bacterium]
MIRVIIADDHTIFREGIKEILSKTSDIVIEAEAENGAELLSKLSTDICDVVLLDINMPGRRGLEILKDIKTLHPDLPVLMLSMYPEKRYAIRAIKSKASGYLTKESASYELINAIKKVHKGGKYISASLAEELASYIGKESEKPLHDFLSEREFEVMLKLAAGKKIKDIADEMFLGTTTVSTYRSRVLGKLNLKTDADIVRYVLENGLAD